MYVAYTISGLAVMTLLFTSCAQPRAERLVEHEVKDKSVAKGEKIAKRHGYNLELVTEEDELELTFVMTDSTGNKVEVYTQDDQKTYLINYYDGAGSLLLVKDGTVVVRNNKKIK